MNYPAPTFYPIRQVDEDQIRFAVIAVRCHGKWLLCRHKDRQTWEMPGGHREPGETPLETASRELFEETGIRAQEDEFEFLGSDRDRSAFYDFYCLKRYVPEDEIVLLPGETDAAQWVTFAQIHQMIADKQICQVIANQFLRQEPELRKRQSAQE